MARTRSSLPTTAQQHEQATRDEILIPLLAQRSFHLPGNSWKEDWIQWMRNNHIVLGICFHHRLHPIETWERLLVILGSVSFAMVATNLGYIWDWYDGEDHDFDPYVVLYSWTMPGGEGCNTGNYYDDNYNYDCDDESTIIGSRTLYITYGTMILWTFGCTFHSLFDILVWNLTACACCHPGGRYGNSEIATKWEFCHDMGSYLLIAPILTLGGLAGYSSYLRVTNTENEELDMEYGDDLVETVTNGKLGEYSFLLRFGVELFLAWFVFFPIVSTVLFSGFFGCRGRLPLLGGRPRDKRLLDEGNEDKLATAESSSPTKKNKTKNHNQSESGNRNHQDGLVVNHSYARF